MPWFQTVAFFLPAPLHELSISMPFLFDGIDLGLGCVFKARVVSDIFAQNLHIFGPNQLQISFLLLQDSIFKIFVPEIK